jgi:hypothetical protein
MCLAVGCEDKADPNNPDNAVPDPAGTITANIAESSSTRINIVERGLIGWTAPDNFYLSGYWGNYTIFASISICNLGAMSGLGNITKIPASGFTAPTSSSNSSVACEAGHGYVVKFEVNGGDPEYLRLYVVESIVNTSGGIIGAKVKYQYPFVP